MDREERLLPHRITVDDRKKLTVTGVTQVEAFDEEEVALKTGFGLLRVQGAGMKLKTLSPETGQVLVEGRIDSLFYETHRDAGGFWRRLLR